MIEFKDVRLGFAGKEVLKGVSFSCPPHQVTAIMGPSGSGKSTALRLVMGFLRADNGSLTVDGEDVTHLTEKAWVRVRRKMGMVFQHSALFDSLTVCQNVAFYPHFVLKQSWRRVRPQVMDLLCELGLEGDADKLPEELSGGMQRRVALARSLIYRPKILLYDEPTTGLDPHMSAVVSELIDEMNEKYKVTSIVVSHDLPSIHDIADHVVLISEGESFTVGQPSELLTSEQSAVRSFAGSWRQQIRTYSTEMGVCGGNLPDCPRRQQQDTGGGKI
jgi:phospholipid/cholesterol/gamma-HCH transport system ATP-binding protein